MTRNVALLFGVAAGAAAAYFAWRSLAGRTFDAMERPSDDQLNTEIEDSFPASDAPSHTPVMGAAR